MHIVAFLADLKRYRDRALAWQRAAAQVGSMTLLTLHDPGDLTLPGVRIEVLGEGLRGVAARLALLRWWQRNRHPVDLLHDTQGFMLPLFARVGRRGPVRLTSAFATSFDWFHQFRGAHPVEWRVREVRNYTYLALEWALARVSDAFTVFGEGHIAPSARAWQVPPDRIFSIPNCVDPQGFSPEGPVGETGFAPGDPVLLFVGQVFRYKGVYELLDALAALRPELPRLRLLMVGDVPPGAEVRAHIERLGVGEHVLLPGPVGRAALPGLMRAASVVVLPSYTEGSPRVLIEAMACGRPIVGTDLPGIAALDPEGGSIPLVPRGDAAALASALRGLLMHPEGAQLAGQRNRARYLAHHTPDAAGDVLADVYRRLARR